MTDSHAGNGDLLGQELAILQQGFDRCPRVTVVVGEHQVDFIFNIVRKRIHSSAPVKQTPTPPNVSVLHRRRLPMFLKCSHSEKESIEILRLWKSGGLSVGFRGKKVGQAHEKT